MDYPHPCNLPTYVQYCHYPSLHPLLSALNLNLMFRSRVRFRRFYSSLLMVAARSKALTARTEICSDCQGSRSSPEGAILGEILSSYVGGDNPHSSFCTPTQCLQTTARLVAQVIPMIIGPSPVPPAARVLVQESIHTRRGRGMHAEDCR